MWAVRVLTVYIPKLAQGDSVLEYMLLFFRYMLFVWGRRQSMQKQSMIASEALLSNACERHTNGGCCSGKEACLWCRSVDNCEHTAAYRRSINAAP